ncbi:MAG: hypothetical protein HQL10_01710 [Nitrospirae bacterium]|nr:hypothetical protein [Nitrospirota bacterium]
MAGNKKIDILFLGKETNEIESDARREMEAIVGVMDEMDHALSVTTAPLLIVLNLSAFRVLPSKFIGMLGRAASSAFIEKVCLCNVQATIVDTFKMLGILSEDEKATTGPMAKIKIYRDRTEALQKLGIDYDLQL